MAMSVARLQRPDHLSRADLIWFRRHVHHGADATPPTRFWAAAFGDVQTRAIALSSATSLGFSYESLRRS